MRAKELLNKVNEVAASRWKQPVVDRPVIDSNQQCETVIEPLGSADLSNPNFLRLDNWISYEQHGDKKIRIYDNSRNLTVYLTPTANSPRPKFMYKDNLLSITRLYMYKVTNLQAILSEYVRQGILFVSNDKLSNYLNES